ncbi:MAG: caspase family protein [Gemmatimonadetes bacterium]|nr:caspase family protein [Gemmatimonadota bacterium]
MRSRPSARGARPAVLFFAGLLLLPLGSTAQEIVFEGDRPRMMVFIQEEGRGKVASREMTSFLREAGFPVIDPALAIDEASQALVTAAMNGNDGAATQLGRDWGAQVIILGVADYATRESPGGGSLITATTEVAVRALRLDLGEVVSDAVADARAIEATGQAARAKAIRAATQEVIGKFIGAVLNDWEERSWQEDSYWVPDPGSIQESAARTASAATGGVGVAPGLAVLSAEVLPAEGDVATRGIGVVRRNQGGSSSVQNVVRLEGVVIGDATSVQVQGQPAQIESMTAEEIARLGLSGSDVRRFSREFTLPISQDSVLIVAEGAGGQTTQTFAAPRIDKRWAVVIGVGKYQSDDIPDLEFATSDARAMKEFLESDAAGPFDEVLYLENERATGAAMREALFVFLQQADWDDLVLIYYAGHGAPDPGRPDNLYLLPTDADLGSLAATGFPMWDVKTALRRQIAAERVIVIADACHAAGTADGDVVGGGASNHIAGGFQGLFTPSRRLMMTAADTNEFSLEDERWGGHGVFTHFLLDGLHGAGDLDGNGIVTFTELFEHVSVNVRAATNGRQNPQRSGFGDIPLAVVGGGGSS